jgi:DNA replicative helicase MCM subunit Mcm2 (Cdc46/Mcm family)
LTIQTQKSKFILSIDLADLKAFEEQLYEKIINNPLEMIRLMEEGIRAYVKEKKEEFPNVKDC